MTKKAQKRIYLDHASATPLDEGALAMLIKSEKDVYGNASAYHKEGIRANEYLENARKEFARIFQVRSNEVIFTSGGTESDNLALQGVITNYELRITKGPKPHIVTTNIEHAAILETCRHLEKTGRATVTYVPVEKNGIVDPKKIKEALTPNTVLISVMYANNEIGAIQPIREIAKEIRHFKKLQAKPAFTGRQAYNLKAGYPLLHTDACQAVNYLPVAFPQLGVDLMSINSSKIYGPKGVGALITTSPLISPLFFGGDQENGLRPGTLPVPLIASFGKALTITLSIQEKENKRLRLLQTFFVTELKKIDGVSINGDPSLGIPNIVNCSIKDIGSELLVTYLDARGISVSAKSACKSDDPEASHVLVAINPICKKGDQGSIRFSMGRSTTKDAVKKVLSELKDILKLLRSAR